jgi:hypothetical protein
MRVRRHVCTPRTCAGSRTGSGGRCSRSWCARCRIDPRHQAPQASGVGVPSGRWLPRQLHMLWLSTRTWRPRKAWYPAPRVKNQTWTESVPSTCPALQAETRLVAFGWGFPPISPVVRTGCGVSVCGLVFSHMHSRAAPLAPEPRPCPTWRKTGAREFEITPVDLRGEYAYMIEINICFQILSPPIPRSERADFESSSLRPLRHPSDGPVTKISLRWDRGGRHKWVWRYLAGILYIL